MSLLGFLSPFSLITAPTCSFGGERFPFPTHSLLGSIAVISFPGADPGLVLFSIPLAIMIDSMMAQTQRQGLSSGLLLEILAKRTFPLDWLG